MKLVTWNCAMALKKKLPKLLTLGADILVIQECSRSDIKQLGQTIDFSSTWFGKNKNKGLGVLAKSPWVIREARALKPKWAAKLVIGGPASIELYPIWACTSKRPAKRYIEHVHFLLDVMEQTPLSQLAIVAGDFNSNTRWDNDHVALSHSAAVERFRNLGMESAYHAFCGDRQGAERRPTFWFRKNKRTVYHIDYAFLSRSLLPKLRSVEVGCCKDWLSFSDHAPVLVDVGL
jgi:exodeoxyribonuclease-3